MLLFLFDFCHLLFLVIIFIWREFFIFVIMTKKNSFLQDIIFRIIYKKYNLCLNSDLDFSLIKKKIWINLFSQFPFLYHCSSPMHRR